MTMRKTMFAAAAGTLLLAACGQNERIGAADDAAGLARGEPGAVTGAAPGAPAIDPPGVSAFQVPGNEAIDTRGGPDLAAPVAGANSFTEEQARRRIEAQGYSSVTGLQLGEDGIWRATAQRNAQTLPVMLDFQGNVTPWRE